MRSTAIATQNNMSTYTSVESNLSRGRIAALSLLPRWRMHSSASVPLLRLPLKLSILLRRSRPKSARA